MHRKYGYDPAELFVNPEINFPSLTAARKLLAKKLGFRIFMDLIPLDPSLVKGTHGVRPADPSDWPLIMGHSIDGSEDPLPATRVQSCLFNALEVEQP